jgi:hypothetical protein
MFRVMLVILFLFSQNVNALQIKDLHKDNRLVADISQDSINRISVDDDRIAQVFGLNEDLVIETDNNTGQIFLRTKQNKPLDLSIITEKQVTLDLRLLPTEPLKINAKITNYLNQITTLMLLMANDKSIVGFSTNKVNKEILLWDKIELLQTSEYVGNKLIGEVYTLTNKTKDRIFLTETQFGWQKQVASVAIKKHALAPKEATQVYIIRHVL